MRIKHLPALFGVAVISTAALTSSPRLEAAAVDTTAGQLHVPIDYYKLPNGLKVVLSLDQTTPTTVVAVYYNIGFRNEPKDRTGFAHLFEHMMFQGSENLGKLAFIRLSNRTVDSSMDRPVLISPITTRWFPRTCSRRCCGPKRTGCAASTSPART